MMERKKSEIIQDALDLLDDDLITEANALREGNSAQGTDSAGQEKIKMSRIMNWHWRRWVATAASVCLLIIGGWAWMNLDIGGNTNIGADGDFLTDGIETQREDNSSNDTIDGMLSDDAHIGEDEESVINNSSSENIIDVEVKNPEVEASTDSDMVIEEMEPVTETEIPNEGDKVEENIVYASMADIYHLQDNYLSVSIIPHKIWESSASEEEAIEQASMIKEKYKWCMDMLLEDMLENPCVLTEELPPIEPEQIYHLFFEKKDGEIVHCWFLTEGFLFYHEFTDIGIILDTETCDTLIKILAMHW